MRKLRDARTVHDTRQLIASQLVRPEGMSQRGGLKRILQVLICVAVCRHHRSDDGDDEQGDNDPEPYDGQLVAANPAYGVAPVRSRPSSNLLQLARILGGRNE